MLHPIPSLMNLNRTDRAQGYDYYIDGHHTQHRPPGQRLRL